MATGALTEEIAANLEEAAEMTRRLDTKVVGYFLGGVGIGAALGFYFGYRWNREKIRAEAFQKSEAEIAMVREVYNQKMRAAQPKPSVDEVMERRGYTPEAAAELNKRLLRPPVPITDHPLREVEPEPEPQIFGEWDYQVEMANRSEEDPYVIHQDEFNENATEYNQVVFTYWAVDDVLSDEDNTILHDIDGLINADNLKWGHGSDDIDVVFIRNDTLELDVQVCRVNRSFGEEVMGIGRDPENEIEHSSYPEHKRTKKRQK